MFYRNILVWFFLILALVSAFFLFRIHFNPNYVNGYITGDWLINYQDGGFKRRGLSGSFAFLIQDFTGIGLEWIVYVLQLSLFFSFFFVFLLLIWKKEISAYYITLVLSPLAFLAYFNDISFLGRKEYFVFLLFALFMYLIDRKKLTIANEAMILISIVIIALFHEIIFFYFPYFIIALYLTQPKPEWKRYSLYAAAVFIPVLAIALLGGEINQGHSLDNIAARGVVLHPSNIFMSSLHMNVQEQIGYTSYWLYVLSFALASLHFGYYIFKNLGEKAKQICFLTISAFIFSLPLFYLAMDWGRWLQIHFMLLLILISYFLKNRNPETTQQLKWWNLVLKDSKTLLLVPLLLFWGIRHCYEGFVPGGVFLSFYDLLTQ